ncbi:hypothetical protein TNIN_463671 [Trichonephila inaurata madagascariensis]|uniref:Uncharacterized protein n=1 Tax=Trichonephila inaurata madagascariensis TaxID=2747483 RepID=A0A8X6XPV9_9ARAC|nr:hypothetical protein TNIN_463671 [Trichonephila inaurata madagascariensis]
MAYLCPKYDHRSFPGLIEVSQHLNMDTEASLVSQKFFITQTWTQSTEAFQVSQTVTQYLNMDTEASQVSQNLFSIRHGHNAEKHSKSH